MKIDVLPGPDATRPSRSSTQTEAGLLWSALSANAYGIYLLHYPVVTWLQYALLGIRADAVLMAGVVFTTATFLSWAGSAILRPLTVR